MSSLILKDILLQKKSFFFALGYSLFVLIAFQNQVLAESSYIMGAMATAYMLVIGACAYEEKNNSEVVLNSLPLKRRDIVLARYLSSFVFVFGAFIIIGLMGALMKGLGLPIPLRYVRPSDAVAVVISLAILTSFYFPVYFRFGYIKSRFFNLILFLLVFFVPSLAVSYIKEGSSYEALDRVMALIAEFSAWQTGVGAVILAVLAMAVSARISLSVYRRREF